MEWIATAALVFIALRIYWFSGAVIEHIESPRIQNVNCTFNPQIVDLLTNFRRRKPKAKELA